jgi:hypothetical protein
MPTMTGSFAYKGLRYYSWSYFMYLRSFECSLFWLALVSRVKKWNNGKKRRRSFAEFGKNFPKLTDVKLTHIITRWNFVKPAKWAKWKKFWEISPKIHQINSGGFSWCENFHLWLTIENDRRGQRGIGSRTRCGRGELFTEIYIRTRPLKPASASIKMIDGDAEASYVGEED